jgi:hypothetical protein
MLDKILCFSEKEWREIFVNIVLDVYMKVVITGINIGGRKNPGVVWETEETEGKPKILAVGIGNEIKQLK